VRQGVVMMLLSLALIPAYVLLAALFPADDRLVESSPSDTPFEKIGQAVLVTLFLLGLARVLYARFFEQGTPEEDGRPAPAALEGAASGRALPPPQGIPVSGFGAWRVDTGEVVRPRAAAESSERE
jgi:hypothetical protein